MTEFGWGRCRSVWKVDLCHWNCHVGHFSEFGQLELRNGKRWRLSPDSVTQTTEAASSFETVEHTHHATWRKNSGDCHLSNACHENLKTYTWHYIPKTVVTEWGTDLLWYIGLVTWSMGKDITFFPALVYEVTNIILLVDQDWKDTFLFSKFCLPS